eukprot:m.129697 g.129697  ORF g.129697 m.129697 type:complete len:518 (+) comp16413_c0_seq2:217-1770(+)
MQNNSSLQPKDLALQLLSFFKQRWPLDLRSCQRQSMQGNPAAALFNSQKVHRDLAAMHKTPQHASERRTRLIAGLVALLLLLAACAAPLVAQMVHADMAKCGTDNYITWFLASPSHRPHTLIFQAYLDSMSTFEAWWISSQLYCVAAALAVFFARSRYGAAYLLVGLGLGLSGCLPLFVLVEEVLVGATPLALRESLWLSPLSSVVYLTLAVTTVAAMPALASHTLLFDINLVAGHILVVLPLLKASSTEPDWRLGNSRSRSLFDPLHSGVTAAAAVAAASAASADGDVAGGGAALLTAPLMSSSPSSDAAAAAGAAISTPLLLPSAVPQPVPVAPAPVALTPPSAAAVARPEYHRMLSEPESPSESRMATPTASSSTLLATLSPGQLRQALLRACMLAGVAAVCFVQHITLSLFLLHRQGGVVQAWRAVLDVLRGHGGPEQALVALDLVFITAETLLLLWWWRFDDVSGRTPAQVLGLGAAVLLSVFTPLLSASVVLPLLLAWREFRLARPLLYPS